MTERAEPVWAKEADLVAAFCEAVDARNEAHAKHHIEEQRDRWTVYHETAGFDLLMVHSAGYQLGIEAKLSLNAEVITQAIPTGYESGYTGPDYRAVLVPYKCVGRKLAPLAKALGVTVMSFYDLHSGYERKPYWHISPGLPDEGRRWFGSEDWYCWLPGERCKVPDYVPDVTGGKAAPVKLTEWKIRAIRLMILLERRGIITRGDLKALGLSPTNWTARGHGFLDQHPSGGGYIRGTRTPDLRAQHPRNYAEIEADFDKWEPVGYKMERLG